ncbi:multiple inositol polyphosphate phosphatase 1 [Eurytemora carolleeae]|uniref:multiple inositol polyphosphate phosphatase 1 n=1 Tax=Eurytemora carolleeae TaxID=1294199 RepID=UPI000C7842A7|nr:multiple inositol polyphosphate phosphatase 1 [Eurytemora carolleeae]|eukprot:XP_023339715.1 multiple inositol polyphosphate phosphatase 1-like [Eurytemora affinis]
MMNGLILILELSTWACKAASLEENGGVIFGTKTSYFPVANQNTSIPTPPGCSPVMFWHLARHGTRYPGKDDIENMRDNLSRLRDEMIAAWNDGKGNLSSEIILQLKNWTLLPTPEDDKLITTSGRKEHFEMGQRWEKRFDNFNFFHPNKTEVYTSYKQRCIESGKEFMKGLFSAELPLVEDNHLLRFYDYCSLYINEVGESETPCQEVLKFETMPVFKEVGDRTEKQTGVQFSKSELDILWDICRFEVSWFPGTWSPWCSVFSIQDLHVYEFREDLKYYYEDGYAYNITKLMTQPLWHDLITRLEVLQEGRLAVNNSVLMFAHAETLMPFLVSLGLYLDQEPVKASDWPLEDRKWKTSEISSFGTNLDVIVLRCSASQVKGNYENTSSEEFMDKTEKSVDLETSKESEASTKSEESKESEESTESDSRESEESEESENSKIDKRSVDSDESTESEESKELEESKESKKRKKSDVSKESKESKESEESKEPERYKKLEELDLIAGEELKIQIMHQEKITIIPGLGDLIPLSAFIQKYKYLADLDFDKICEN